MLINTMVQSIERNDVFWVCVFKIIMVIVKIMSLKLETRIKTLESKSVSKTKNYEL
jgi:hypothetical protein